MTKEEALKLALEALEYPGPSWLEARQPAITAIKEALQIASIIACRDALDAQPVPRRWVGLTEEEVIEISHLALTRAQAVLMTAAKLKELNT
jgi:hypothetical protein